MVRKPVIYLYPEERTNVRVHVQVQGEFLAQYPVPGEDGWHMVALPDGTLFDRANERKYSYLFWEAKSSRAWAIEPNRAFCVRRDEVDTFLERVCHRMCFNDKERTDFISYWIGALQRNEYSLIQFLGDEYESYARMTVEPKPDTMIRLFMIFRGSKDPVPTGNPELPRVLRRGFSVVEWGGANLDEMLR